MLALALLPTALAAPPTAPREVAEAVARQAGDPTAAERLRFTFVVEKAGEEKARRSHDWAPQAGTLTVTMGAGAVRLEGLHGHDLSAAAADPAASAAVWAEVSPGTDPAAAAQAWGAFVNDSYWLLAPSKVLDPGVQAEVVPGGLALAFDGVGLTPGDRYVLRLDPSSHRVVGWTFVLEGGREGAFDWTGHERFGPLELATRRVSADGELVIRFEDVSVQ